MIRWLLLILGGALLGGIVHLATVIILPRTATQDAYARLAPIAPVNSVVALPPPTPEKAVMPFMDPAFASAICLYDLSQGPLKLTVPVSPAYTSVSFYTRNNVAYYAINDRAAGRRVIELDLMTRAQHEQVPEDEEVTAADRLIVDSPTPTGIIAIRAMAPEPGLMRVAQSAIAASKCATQQRSRRGRNVSKGSAGRSEARLPHPGRRQRAIAIDLGLQLIEHTLYFNGLRLRCRDDQALEREAIGCDPIGEALVNDLDHVRVLANSAFGVDPLFLVQPGHIGRLFCRF